MYDNLKTATTQITHDNDVARLCDCERILNKAAKSDAQLGLLMGLCRVTSVLAAPCWAFWADSRASGRWPPFVFAWACIVQCITNYHSKRFVGTENACDVQAWYATYYVFSAIGLAAYGILLGYHLIRTGDASLPCQSSLSPKSILPHLLPGVLIHAMAALFASLPLFGLKGYMFATDYCMFNIEAPLFSSLFLSYFGLAVAAVAFAAVSATRSVGGSAAGGSAAGGSASGGSASGGRSPTRTSLRLLVVTSVYLSIAWLTTCVIAAMWMANGKVYGSAEWRIYGAQAIILHSNQLFTPLLFGYLWRYCMQAVLDEQGLTQGATKV